MSAIRPTTHSVPTYRVTLKKGAPLRVAEKACSSSAQLSRVVLAWFRATRPAGECILLVGVDSKNAVIGVVEVARGGIAGCACTPREIFQAAFAMNAAAILLAHNHPSEDPTPSPDDIVMTKAVADISNMIGMPLLDHIVVAVESGACRSIFEEMGR